MFDDYRAHYGQPSTPEITRSWLHDQIAQHGISVAAATRADHVCGFITVMITPASLMLGTFWSIRDLYVPPHHRRSGIANALLRHVIRNARAAGAHRVSLQTETDNTPRPDALHRHRLPARHRPGNTQPHLRSHPRRSGNQGLDVLREEVALAMSRGRCEAERMAPRSMYTWTSRGCPSAW
ncbi:GNAT family N-acetyltransferase [Micromonospora sp. NPDC005223]|uniref:GNAT family N-acetyltransferase n=1 Tax=unclassified Micromonospora TaxID=2617518 RepID=UPI0033F55F46